MRLTIFTTACLIAANTSSAISLDLEAQTQSQSQAAAGENKRIEAKVGSQSLWPKNKAVGHNCCEFYSENSYNAKDLSDAFGLEASLTNGGFETEILCTQENGEAAVRVGTFPIESYRCGKNTWLDMETGTKSLSSAAGRHSNPYATGTKATVGAYSSKDLPAVTIFDGLDCSGLSTRLYYNDDPDVMGAEYLADQLQGNNSMSKDSSYINEIPVRSVMVPPGYFYHAYPEDQFLGIEHPVISGKFADGVHSNSAACQNVGVTTMSDTTAPLVGSIRINKRQQGQATGYWKGITASEKLSYKVEVGFSRREGQTNTQSVADIISDSLQMGFKVAGEAEAAIGGFVAKASLKVNSDFYRDTQESNYNETHAFDEISSMTDSNQGQEFETTCTPKANEEGAGIWQWVITTEDRTVSAFTNHTICRTGALYKTAPTCSYWDCQDASCSKCSGDDE